MTEKDEKSEQKKPVKEPQKRPNTVDYVKNSKDKR
jgi:hypothetical protein